MSNFFNNTQSDAIYDQLEAKEQKHKRHHKTTGYCLSCNAPLQDRAFCDNWCKEDYEFESDMRGKILKSKR
jgi:hypothetical protein